MRRAVYIVIAVLAAMGPASAQPQDPPRFRSSVDVTSVDVTVLDNQGRPITGLTPGDFTVTVDGSPRRIVSAEWMALATPAGGPPPLPPPEGYTTNEHATGGRLILLVIDEPNIRFGGAVGMRSAVDNFVDRLQPSDRIAAVGIGPGSPSTPFTADRERVKTAIGRMAGQRASVGSDRYRIALSEAVAIRRGDSIAFVRVVSRECAEESLGTPGYELCTMAVGVEAERMGQTIINESEATIDALRQLLTGLAAIDAPKTIILVSEGFVAGDNDSAISELGVLASAARASLYALRLEEPLFDITQAQAPIARFDDRLEKTQGLEMLVGATRGSMFTVSVGAEGAFARIESELSGYYLLAVETEPRDRDGDRHPIRVRVSRQGATVRARRELASTADDRRPRGPRAALAAALASPLPLAALPLRAATFSLRTPDDKIQVLIHAEVGLGYVSPRVVNLAFHITDAAGRIVDSRSAAARLQPVMIGVPSALQYTGSASLPPGEYTLKLAVAEGDAVGTVEHPIRAALVPAAPLELSELMVGGPSDSRARLAPTVGHTVTFGTVHGYMEAYGAGAAGVSVKYEVAADPDAAALLEAEVTPRAAGDDRAIFTQTIAVRQLPPGPYVLRAIVSADDQALKTLHRSFEVAAPAVLMLSAESAGSAPAATELYLPVADELFMREFRAEEATRPETLQAFKSRVAPSSAATFEEGLGHFAEGDYPEAEQSFKRAIDADSDSTAAFAYLAAVFAAAGHDTQAAGAWQTALIEGDDLPQIYLWLADALMRAHDLAQARNILEEASAKWPADVRFAKPMALVYATFGQGREAVRTLVRHLEAHPEDRDSLSLGVEWIYHLHTNGAVARSRAEDLTLARRYAAAYEKARGPQTALVKRWIASLEGRRRE